MAVDLPVPVYGPDTFTQLASLSALTEAELNRQAAYDATQDGVVAGQVSALAALTARVTALENAGGSDLVIEQQQLQTSWLADGVTFKRNPQENIRKMGYIVALDTILQYSGSISTGVATDLVTLPAAFRPGVQGVFMSFMGTPIASNMFMISLETSVLLRIPQRASNVWAGPLDWLQIHIVYLSNTFGI
jgi:hypothetical protein